MLKETLIDLLTQAAVQAQQSGKLPSVTLPPVTIERPQNPEHGDYASSLSLKLARATSSNPLDIAGNIVAFIADTPEIERIDVAAPGFINFTLNAQWLAGQANSILEAGESYGNIEIGHDKRVQIEFVSVNPTGPLHVGHGRGAILGSTLASALAAAGYHIEKEYYINDAGNQIDAFSRSLYARYVQCLGKEVAIVEMTDRLCADANFVVMMGIQMRLEDGVRCLVGAECTEISAQGVRVTFQDGSTELIPADSVVLAAGMQSTEDVVESMLDCAADVIPVGDCIQPGTVRQASRTAYYAALDI